MKPQKRKSKEPVKPRKPRSKRPKKKIVEPCGCGVDLNRYYDSAVPSFFQPALVTFLF